MAWERRSNGRKYFYVGRRVGGRVVKEYFGCGPAALLAEQQMEARKQRRKADLEAVRAEKDQLSISASAIEHLARSTQCVSTEVKTTINPVQGPNRRTDTLKVTPPLPKSGSQFTDMSHTDPISCIQELLSRVQHGDSTADSELELLLGQYPDLWLQMGDVGEQALQAWLTLVSGGVSVLAMATKKKLDTLREELLAGGLDVATRLHADRVMATWLQVTYADSKYALADRTCLPMLEFLARRQKQAQQQHLSALNAWRIWSRAQGQAFIPDQPTDVSVGNEANAAQCVLPFSRPILDEPGQKRSVARR